MAQGRRICLFGGTFDPIHNAHLQIADAAQQALALDEVLFIPAANPPHKDSASLTSFEDRFRMVEIACKPYPAFIPSRLEESEARSYTISTLERFRARLGQDDELYFLIGSDAFADLETWHRWQDVLKLTTFIVVSRPGEHYHIPEGAHVIRLDGLDLPVASTTIRARIAEGERTPELPDAVRRYIDEKGLYRPLDGAYCFAGTQY
ncbi:MAG: nicotinate-nucleotide adenylyltransferase [Bryobacteraceae bacterium]